MNRLTFIGKAVINQYEADVLRIFGRALWRMGVDLTCVPKGQANEAVIAGVEAESGVVRKIPGQALQAARDGLVIYSEPTLLAAIKEAAPNLDLDADAVVIEDEEELNQYVEALLAEVWRVENSTNA